MCAFDGECYGDRQSSVFFLQGTVLLSPQVALQTELGCSCYEFQAHVTSGEEGLEVGRQVTLYIGAAVQNAVVKVYRHALVCVRGSVSSW